jgi:hypothetical protein
MVIYGTKTYDEQDSIGKSQPLLFGHYYRFNPIEKIFRRYYYGSNYSFGMDKFNTSTGKYELMDQIRLPIKMESSMIKSMLTNFVSYEDDRMGSYHYVSSKNPNVSPDEAKIVFWNANLDSLIIEKKLTFKSISKNFHLKDLGQNFSGQLQGKTKICLLLKPGLM